MENRRRRLFKVAVLFGFLLIHVGVYFAYTNPVREYEYSIYSQSPPIVWFCVSIAIILSTIVVFSTDAGRINSIALSVSGLAMLCIISLPIIRGYYYKGEGDALSHLGRTMDLMAGYFDVNELVYPAVYLFASTLQFITGIPLNTVLLLTVVIFIVLFFVFVPLSVREIASDRRVTLFSVFSGFFLLPVNHNSGGIWVHPTSQAHMFAPFVIFSLLLFYLRRGPRAFMLLLVSFSTYVILHPQQAANLLIVLATFVVVHYLVQNWNRVKVVLSRPNIVYTLSVSVAIFWVWIYRLGRFESHLAGRIERVFMDTNVGRPTTARVSSLEAVGGSVPEVFFKLFFVPFLFSMVTAAVGLVVLVVLFRPGIERSTINVFSEFSELEKNTLAIFTGSILPLFVMFLVYLQHGTGSDQYFRHHAFIMIIVTIVGAIGIGKVVLALSGTHAAKTFVFVSLVLLFLSIPVIFPSPYFYQSSNHVTEAQVEGFETIYEYDDESIEYDRLRSNPSRYMDVAEDPTESRGFLSGVPSQFADHNISDEYDDEVYIPVTESSIIQDAVVWNGLNFGHDDFRYVDRTSGSNRVVSNGGVSLYLVEPDSNDD